MSRNTNLSCKGNLVVHSWIRLIKWELVQNIHFYVWLNPYRNSRQRYFVIKRAFGNFRPATQAYNFIKKYTLAQVFSSEFCEISKNTLFTEHLLATAYFLKKLWDSLGWKTIDYKTTMVIKLYRYILEPQNYIDVTFYHD